VTEPPRKEDLGSQAQPVPPEPSQREDREAAGQPVPSEPPQQEDRGGPAEPVAPAPPQQETQGASNESAPTPQPQSQPSLPYQVQLERYEGPLDLLLDLIRKQQIDIHDIPIAKITGQYLEYLHHMERFDIDISADFLYMAATLIYIKSKMLLPSEPVLPGQEPQEDPREQLVHQLLEHEKFKSAAQMLHERQQIEDHVWSKPDRSLYEGAEAQGELVVSLIDLVKVFQSVLERRRERKDIELERDEFTVGMMIARMRDRLRKSDSLRLVDFFEKCPTRRAMISAFLAVLELTRLGAVLVVQNETFSEILLRKHKMFDIVFSGEPGEGPFGNLDQDYD
jgi:segregation and condensation protein A